ncbi:TetR/AcrR family transcriptional regulator, partial [Bacillus cereus]|nr:TetR/AcrR family transcriptional regulator [Bacillus cereus]
NHNPNLANLDEISQEIVSFYWNGLPQSY